VLATLGRNALEEEPKMRRGRLSSMAEGASEQRSYTAEEALRLDPYELWELVEGRVIPMSPAGGRHGGIVTRVGHLLSAFVDARGVGFVLSGDAGFVLRRNPDTVRAPDVAFVRRRRLPKGLPLAFVEGAPDLAVEVKSPDEHWPFIGRKAREFIAAGTVAVWVVDVKKRAGRIYTAKSERLLGADGIFTCSELLAGFELRLSELWR
jgi:Uma2 family endonuclease